MTKTNVQSFVINFTFISTAVFCVSENLAALDNQSQTIFSAPVKGNEEASVQHAVPALNLGTFEIPSSHGRITFLDETPSAKTPSISVVVVEGAHFNTIAEVASVRTSALELFLAFAPPGTEIPERIRLAENVRGGRDTRGDELKPASYLPLWDSTPAPPVVEPDDWSYGCVDVDAWTNEFTDWVFNFNFLAIASFHTELVNIVDATTGYGYFGFNDDIWVGVCARSGNTMHVGVQYLNFENYWAGVGGLWSGSLTNAELLPGERYLYHSFKPFTAQRRVYVSAEEDADDGSDIDYGNWAIISMAWDDKFAQDTTYAHP